MKEVIKLKNIRKNFNNIKALKSVNLSVYEGEILGLIGPNGAGKTTTLRIISAILKPDRGEAFVYGKVTTFYEKEVKKLIGYLPETPRLYENIKVIESVNMFAKGRDISLSPNFSLALLKEWGLLEISNRPIKTLSKGQKQKVNFLCSLLHDPPLIILDEPFTGLDIESREFIRERIKMISEKGKTILISSHDLDEVERLSTRIAIIAKGEIILQGNVEEIKNKLLGHVYRLKISRIPVDIEFIGNIVKKYTLDEEPLSIIFQVQNREEVNEVLRFFIQRGIIIYSLQPLRLEEHLSGFLKIK